MLYLPLQKLKIYGVVLKNVFNNNGKTIHFSKYGELPCIRAKQINRGISMSVKDNGLKFKLKGNVFGIQVKDRFQTDEVLCSFRIFY